MTAIYQQRITALKEQMKERQIEVGLVTSPKNIYYYTGFHSEPYERFMALLLDGRTDQLGLFIPALDYEAAKQHSFVEQLIPIFDEQNPYQVVKDHIGEEIKSLGVETKRVTLHQQTQLNDHLSISGYLDIGDFIASQRMRKTPEECLRVERAVQIVEKVLAEGMKKVAVGMTELELAAEMELLMRRFGADGPSFSTTVLSGVKSSLPHGHSDEKKLQWGEFLLIDMGVMADGYCSDISRTFVIGEASAEQEKLHRIVRQATEAGVRAAKAGIAAKEVDRAAREVIKQNGYGRYFNNRVGHGLGIEVHEEPSIHENNELMIENGFLFTVEPGIYVPNWGGIRIEEDVYIGEDGKANVLTTFPTELIRVAVNSYS